jgi:hypothetical protein
MNSAPAHDFRQNGFAISVNGCHLDQSNDASARVPNAARFYPPQLELNRPPADQLIPAKTTSAHRANRLQ